MTSTVTVTDLLANEGIADVTGLWPVEMVEDWNRRLDPIFAGTDGERRSYASADALAETGIFAELFSEPVRQLIAGIHPSALLYHCHSYEIAANQGRPHIHRDKPLGWHRDTETILTATFDLDQIRNYRNAWGVFRDRRPELYGPIATLDGHSRR